MVLSLVVVGIRLGGFLSKTRIAKFEVVRAASVVFLAYGPHSGLTP